MHQLIVSTGLICTLIAPAIAYSQTVNLRNKSILYQAVDNELKGYLYIAATGTIFWSATADFIGLGGKDKGVRFKLNGSLGENHKGCQVTSTSALSGNVLTLGTASTCPSISTSDSMSMTITISGDECSLVQSSRFNSPQTGNVSSSIRSTSCRIVPGNAISR
ncbi:MAG: hypothetical protein HY242_03940 [Afipia sp.]|nr:hypothetical protein [Afipia sp.]